MRRLIRLDHWPFASGDAASIHWVRSPWFDVAGDQWRSAVRLRLPDGRIRELEFPWGALPWMRLGQWLRNGEMIDRQMGDVTNIFVNFDQAVLTEAGDAITSDLYPLCAPQDVKEKCWVCPSGSWTVILPVTECIRAFFIPTKAFAYGLLEPSFPERVVSLVERHPDRLKLHFTTDITLSALTPPVVLLTARLLGDESFLDGWRSVYQSRFKAAQNQVWEESIPLETTIPGLRPRWRVRGIRKANRFLVLEILGVEPIFDLPFGEIEFEHPNLVQAEPTEGATKVHHTIDQPTGLKMETGPEPANAAAEPAMLPTPPIPVLERKRHRVRGIRRPRPNVNHRGDQSVPPTKDLIVHPNPTDEEETVTAADIGIGGRTRGAEFVPLSSIPTNLEPEDGLIGFVEAIWILQGENPELTMSWSARELPEGKAFALVNGRARKYVVVGLFQKEKIHCWILEIGRPDDFSISTLLFAIPPPNSQTNPEQIVAGLLFEGLHTHGGWNRAEVEALEHRFAIKIGWVKHYEHSAGQWAQRLLRKILESSSE